MAKQVKLYIDNCEECKLIKPPNTILRPFMGKPFQVDRIFQHLFIDFLGPYPRSTQGHSYLLIVLDQLSKFVLCKTMTKATGSNVIKFLDEIFNLFGAPESILTDNGSQFVGKQFQDLLNSYGVKHLRTGSYAPQSNSSERVNRSIISSIRAYLSDNENHSKWDLHLPSIMGALRSSLHSSTGTTPYQAVFGQQMIQHASMYKILRNINALDNADITILSSSDRQTLLRQKIKDNLLKAHVISSKKYNTRAKERVFKVGQEVLKRNHFLSSAPNQFCKKFAKQFQRCRVRNIVASNLYDLEKLNGEHLGVFHAKDLLIR